MTPHALSNLITLFFRFSDDSGDTQCIDEYLENDLNGLSRMDSCRLDRKFRQRPQMDRQERISAIRKIGGHAARVIDEGLGFASATRPQEQLKAFFRLAAELRNPHGGRSRPAESQPMDVFPAIYAMRPVEGKLLDEEIACLKGEIEASHSKGVLFHPVEVRPSAPAYGAGENDPEPLHPAQTRPDASRVPDGGEAAGGEGEHPCGEHGEKARVDGTMPFWEGEGRPASGRGGQFLQGTVGPSPSPSRSFGVISRTGELVSPDHEFSSTEIRNFLECPYKWFIGQRIRPRRIDSDFGPMERGNVLHGALEIFYKRFTGLEEAPRCAHEPRVTRENLDLALEVLEPCVDDYLQVAPRGNLPISEADSESVAGMRETLRRFVASDAEFLPGFSPSGFECRFGRDSGTGARYAGVWVQGKVDRLDRDTASGDVVVTDYKTGRVSSFSTYARDGRLTPQIQTALYASVIGAITGERTVASLFRSIGFPGQQAGVFDGDVFTDPEAWGLQPECGLSSSPGMPDTCGNGGEGGYAEYLSRVEGYVSEALSRLLDGDLAPRPWTDDELETPCRLCIVSASCPRAFGPFPAGGGDRATGSRGDDAAREKACLDAAVQMLANPLDERAFSLALVSPLLGASDDLLLSLKRVREGTGDGPHGWQQDSMFTALLYLALDGAADGQREGEASQARALWARLEPALELRWRGDLAGALELLVSESPWAGSPGSLGDGGGETQDLIGAFIGDIRHLQDGCGQTPFSIAGKLRGRHR